MCWGVPALLVVIFVIINYTVEDSIQYGGTDVHCLLYGTVALMVGFLVPLVISVTFNISGVGMSQLCTHKFVNNRYFCES